MNPGAGDNFPTASIKVGIYITHTWIGDITLTLTANYASRSPISCVLFSGQGGGADDIGASASDPFVFDDASPTALGSVGNYASGTTA